MSPMETIDLLDLMVARPRAEIFGNQHVVNEQPIQDCSIGEPDAPSRSSFVISNALRHEVKAVSANNVTAANSQACRSRIYHLGVSQYLPLALRRVHLKFSLMLCQRLPVSSFR